MRIAKMKLRSADATQAAGKLGHGLNQNADQGLIRRLLSIWRPGACSLCSIGRLADLTEVTTQLLWPESEDCACASPKCTWTRQRPLRRLVRHCGQNLSEDEVPREIALVDALAHTPEGYVDSFALLASNSITDF
jgi:hypothetical protein